MIRRRASLPAVALVLVLGTCGYASARGHQTPTIGGADQPRWSPNGRTIAFELERDNGTLHIEIVDVRTGASRDLTPAAVRTFDPAWSPVGKRLVYGEGNSQMKGDLYAIDPSGGHRRLLARNAREAAWSPDGKRIVYWVEDYGSAERLAIINPTGKLLTTIGLTRSFALRYPTWMPNGKEIAFRANGGNGPVYAVRLDGTHVRVLVRGMLATGAWSPDRRRVAYNDGRGALYAIDRRTGRRTRLAADGNAWSAGWSADGRMLAFTRGRAGSTHNDLYIVNANGTGLRKVFTG